MSELEIMKSKVERFDKIIKLLATAAHTTPQWFTEDIIDHHVDSDGSELLMREIHLKAIDEPVHWMKITYGATSSPRGMS